MLDDKNALNDRIKQGAERVTVLESEIASHKQEITENNVQIKGKILEAEKVEREIEDESLKLDLELGGRKANIVDARITTPTTVCKVQRRILGLLGKPTIRVSLLDGTKVPTTVTEHIFEVISSPVAGRKGDNDNVQTENAFAQWVFADTIQFPNEFTIEDREVLIKGLTVILEAYRQEDLNTMFMINGRIDKNKALSLIAQAIVDEAISGKSDGDSFDARIKRTIVRLVQQIQIEDPEYSSIRDEVSNNSLGFVGSIIERVGNARAIVSSLSNTGTGFGMASKEINAFQGRSAQDFRTLADIFYPSNNGNIERVFQTVKQITEKVLFLRQLTAEITGLEYISEIELPRTIREKSAELNAAREALLRSENALSDSNRYTEFIERVSSFYKFHSRILDGVPSVANFIEAYLTGLAVMRAKGFCCNIDQYYGNRQVEAQVEMINTEIRELAKFLGYDFETAELIEGFGNNWEQAEGYQFTRAISILLGSDIKGEDKKPLIYKPGEEIPSQDISESQKLVIARVLLAYVNHIVNGGPMFNEHDMRVLIYKTIMETFTTDQEEIARIKRLYDMEDITESEKKKVETVLNSLGISPDSLLPSKN